MQNVMTYYQFRDGTTKPWCEVCLVGRKDVVAKFRVTTKPQAKKSTIWNFLYRLLPVYVQNHLKIVQ